MTVPSLAIPLSLSSVPARKPCVLAVDDDRVMLSMLEQSLKGFGYNVQTAASGNQALPMLLTARDTIDAIILDQEMPGLGGLQVVAQMKADPSLSSIPVIMLTGNGAQETIRAGIDAGVFYYMVKPANDELIKSVVASAVRERQQKRLIAAQMVRYDVAFKTASTMQFSVRTLSEAENVSCLLASCFPKPERVVTGLMDLLVNAVEHGNLAITYEEKTRLLAEGTWQDEIARRLTMPDYADRKTDVIYQRKAEGWFVQITDQGQGFDWKRYWHINPSQATSSHGRGIARAKLLSFDRLIYNEVGNQVKAVVLPSSSETFTW